MLLLTRKEIKMDNQIRVNMTPNHLDLKTLHCSQGDTEARTFKFELHNNGENVDVSGVREQIAFKAYKDGTEEIQPVNGFVPVTSPFKGDIKYPQGLLTDQEFLYRQSPTESNGLAKITGIKGNTLVWNQLIRNGNFSDTSNWSAESGATLSISNNIATISSTTASNGIRQYLLNSLTVNHKYLIKAEFNVPSEYRCVIGTGSAQGLQFEKLISTTNTWAEVSGIGTCTAETTAFYCFVRGTTYENVKIRNVMCIDITQMGLDITDPSDFTSLFPLSYYDFNQGSLLSFNGNGIKTVGKNKFKLNPSATSSNIINVINETTGAVDVADTTAIRWSTPYIGYTDVIAGKTYTASLKGGVTLAYGRIGGSTTTSQPSSSNQPNTSIGGAISSLITNVTPSRTFVANETQRIYWYYCTDSGNANHQEFTFYPQIELDSTASEFEPYTSSTLSLPISTYFPTGMKSAGNVYDELTESKAITRIGSITLNGSEAWVKSTSYPGNYYVLGLLSDVKYQNPTAISNSLILVYNTTQLSANDLCFMFDGSANSQNVNIKNTSMTTLDQFKAWLQANPVTIYYELKTPTETSFTTASLVTENAEIPLSNNDGTLIGKCTEELSAEPGFHDAKIKLSDSDGECYSNKLQLHVERSPQ